MRVKTIDVDVKEWFDKTYGNSYFSAQVVINYGMKTAKKVFISYEYGYGSHALTVAMRRLEKLKIIKDLETNEQLHSYCTRKGIILRHNKEENCLKRQMISFGIE